MAELKIYQDDILQVTITGPVRATILRSMAHYARLISREGRPWRVEGASPAEQAEMLNDRP